MFENTLIKVSGLILAIIAIFSIAKDIRNNQNIPISTPSPSIETTISTTTPTITKEDVVIEKPISKIIPKKEPAKPIVDIVTPIIPKAPPKIDFENINVNTRKALVNILCTTVRSGSFSPISGSGIIISTDGVILTNAHIAEYYLLKDFNGHKDFINCTIRTNSPAYPTYNAKLVYISPTWVDENINLLSEQDPKGTGENDYALLKITSRIDKNPITYPIPYIQPQPIDDIELGDNILLASYPAEFIGGISIERDLYQSSSITQVSKGFTFSTSTLDLISIPGTILSQKGSSGGGAIDDKGMLIGLISTSSDGKTTGERDLRAITISYINRDLEKRENRSLEQTILNADSISDDFNKNIAPELTKKLTNAILKK